MSDGMARILFSSLTTLKPVSSRPNLLPTTTYAAGATSSGDGGGSLVVPPV